MAGTITVDPAGISTVVNVSGGNVYAAASGGSPLTFPKTISTPTVWYVQDPSAVTTRTVTATVGGVQVANTTGTAPIYVNVPANLSAVEQAQTTAPASTLLTPQMFGAVGDLVTDDTAAFQSALDTIAADGNGELYLPATPAGGYLVGALTFSGSYAEIRGSRAVTLKLKNGANAPLLATPNDGVQRNGLRLRGFALDGNAANQTGSAPLIDIFGMHDFCATDLYIANPRGAGIRIGNAGTATCLNPYLSGLIIRGDATNSQGAGIDLESKSSDAHVLNCDIGQFSNDGGILLAGHNGGFVGNTDVWQCKFGYHLFAANRTRFTNCLSDLATLHGWFCQQSSDLQLGLCQARESSQAGSGLWDGFEFEGASGNVATDAILVGCRAMGTLQRYGINFAQYLTRFVAVGSSLAGNVTGNSNIGATGITSCSIA